MQGGNEMKASKMFKSIASSVLVMAMVVPMLASAPATTTQAAKKMAFNTKSALLTVGSTKSVKVKNFAKGSKFTWKTSSSKVATVAAKKSKATITAKGAGNARISCVVKKGKKKTTVSGLTIKVRQKVTSFTIQDTGSKSVTSTDLKTGEKMVLKGAINNNASGSTTNQTVTWSSSDKTIAKVKKKNINQATVTALKAGTVTITATVAYKSKTDKKTASCSIKVTGSTVPDPDDKKATAKPTAKATTKPTATPNKADATCTPWKYSDPDVIYQQHYDEITRWYDAHEAKNSPNGHKHDGYKNNSFAIWMVGFFDNEFSTNEAEHNGTSGPDLQDYKQGGKDPSKLRVSGEFKYDGDNQKQVLFQINITSPAKYPIMYRWTQGGSTLTNPDISNDKASLMNHSSNLKSGGKYGDEEAKAGEWHKLDLSFSIPSGSKNGDTDEKGNPYGFYTYFPNQPAKALIYNKSNTFHFRDFLIKKDK